MSKKEKQTHIIEEGLRLTLHILTQAYQIKYTQLYIKCADENLNKYKNILINFMNLYLDFFGHSIIAHVWDSLLIAIFAIALFSHNLTIAVAKPWCSLFLPIPRQVSTDLKFSKG